MDKPIDEERSAVLTFLRDEASRMRDVANEYTAKHNDREAARKWLRDAELIGQFANRIERGEHHAKHTKRETREGS